jgi:hypothetical protein
MPTQLWIPDGTAAAVPPRLWNPKYISHFEFRSAEECCGTHPSPSARQASNRFCTAG